MGLNTSQVRAVLCMDLDGTLIDANENAHPRDIELLNHFPQEVLPIFATGRNLPSARGVLDQNGILKGGAFPFAGAFINGTVAQLPGEKIIKVDHLHESILPDLAHLTQIFTTTAMFFYQPDRIFLVNPTPVGRELARLHYMNAIVCRPEDLPKQINKAMAVDKNLDVIDQIRHHTKDFPAEMGTSLPYILEISPLGINKANSVQALLDQMGFTELPVYAVGDGENDLALKDMVKEFFVPSSAQASVRSQADVIIDRARDGILSPIFDKII